MSRALDATNAVFELVHDRSEFLEVLDDDAYEKRMLVDELDVSRSTVDRALRELESGQLVTEDASQYRTTFYGHLLLAIYRAFLDTLEHVQQAQPLLPLLPADAEIDITVFIDADIYLAEEPALHVPATHVAELVAAATEVKALAYANTASEASKVIQQEIRDGMTMETVFRHEMFTTVKQTDGEQITDLLQCDQYSAYVTDDLPFGLFLCQIDEEWQLCLLVYGPNQNLNGVIINDNPDAVAWAFDVYTRYRDTATPISPPDQTDNQP